MSGIGDKVEVEEGKTSPKPKTRGGTAKRGRTMKSSTMKPIARKENNLNDQNTEEGENDDENIPNGQTQSNNAEIQLTESESNSDVKENIKQENETGQGKESYKAAEVIEKVKSMENKQESESPKINEQDLTNSVTEVPSKTKESEMDVPELDEAPPPSITAPTNTAKGLKLRTSLSTCDNDDSEEKKNNEKMEDDNQIPEEFTVVEEVESDSDDVQEVPIEKLDTTDGNKTSLQAQTLEDMTIIDEVIDDSEKKDSGDSKQALEPDTEMVSEDELPAEVSKEPLETEAVSDEELPTSGDLPDTEAVSEDELPPEGTEKKQKKRKRLPDKTGKDGTAKSKTTEGGATKKESSKRKLTEGEYDPSSPTSETSDDSRPSKKAAIEGKSSKPAKAKLLPELEKYWKAVKEDATDFTGWTYLLQYVDQENDVEAAREAYDAFLSHYPYCYGYWRKFADYEKRKGNKSKCEEVFERGLKAIPFSVDLWIHYINYCKATFSDNEELLRNTFEKALEACGLEFRSDRLWESYLKWESENKNLLNVTKIYDRLLATITQGYQNHFDQFCEHVNNNAPNKIVSVDEFLTLRQEVLQLLKQSEITLSEAISAPGDDLEAPPGEEPAGEAAVVLASPEETAKLREKIIAERKKVHLATKEAVQARQIFEEGIKRPYFHVKPLERCQLKNWKDYLEFEISQGDQKRISVLFERCLIACALYEEFWLRYLRYMEENTPENVDTIRDVYERTCTIHHKKKPTLHLHWAIYEETQGNFKIAEEILINLEKVVPNLIQVSYRRINLARRSGNLEEAAQLYEHYIEKAKNKIISNNMSIKYARFCWKILNDVDKAVTVLKKALEKDKENPRLYLQLIDMALQREPLDLPEVVAVMDQYLAREGTEIEQRVMFAQRKIEFLEDFGSSAKSVQKATDEFQKLMKQLQERKKKHDDNKIKPDESGVKKLKSDSKDTSGSSYIGSQMSQPPSASAGPYSAPSYNQGGFSQPPPQNNYQAGFNQQPPYNQPPYNQQYNQNDPNYNNYQSWGYSQTGYGNYSQPNWGGYNYY